MIQIEIGIEIEIGLSNRSCLQGPENLQGKVIVRSR
jgi:hypothetical protein